MRVYLAGTFSEQNRLRQYKESLFRLGHTVLSTWLEEQPRPDGLTDEQFGSKMATKDLQEIAASDCFILDLSKPSKTMGKMVETGFALAKHKLFYVVDQDNEFTSMHIFLMLADKRFASWDALLGHFEENHNSNKKAG